MLKSHDRFYSESGKRLVLVVDDEFVNREMLKMILESDYSVITSDNGQAALETIQELSQKLSLVILDLMMPVMSGIELLSILKADSSLRRIPVIVLTSEKDMEVESLQMGASDFIRKPYNMPEVIRARVRRTIELAEDTYIIQNTERDALTGLLNKEFFFRYCEQYGLHHEGTSMDAAVIDMSHFHLVNEIHGWKYGDHILKKVGEKILNIALRYGGVAGRGDGDEFYLYLPAGVDFSVVHSLLQEDLDHEESALKIRARMGVYLNANRGREVERQFDRARVSVDTIKNNYNQFIAYYDDTLHEREMLHQQLIDDMDKGLQENQFKVFYQPKFDIRGEAPVLSSSEALVRWFHPQKGFVSPGVFIPLFESNGLINKLDRFVWREAARQVKAWRDEFGIQLSVSVNVSRIDLYAPDFVPYLLGLMEEFEIEPSHYFLEVTESAYTEDSNQIIRIVKELRSYGFKVEMDDFGSGYSSLNMFADLPVDYLKLDMRFIQNLHEGEKNYRMVKLMIDIAKHLEVGVVAEGVETKEQYDALKAMGCDVIQGFYFSGGLAPEKFRKYFEKGEEEC